MTKYIYLDNLRTKNARLGISTKVFKFIAKKALSKVDEINEDDANEINIGIKNNLIVTFKINAVVRKNTDKNAIKDEIKTNIFNAMNLLCDLPFEATIKVIEKN